MPSTVTPPRTATRSHRLGRALAYALPTAGVLFGVGLLVRSQWDPLIGLDDAGIDRATALTRPREGLTDALILWQRATQPFNLYVVGAALCLWVYLAKGLRSRAWWAFGTMMLAWMVGLGAKYLFQRARPVLEDPVSQSPGYSFPSGHALNSAAWATIVVILLWPLLKPRWARVIAVVLAVAFVTVTALDRVLLGVHYPTDVSVGVITGVGLALGSYAGYVGWHPPDDTPVDDPDVDPANNPDVDSDINPADRHPSDRPGLDRTTSKES